MSQVRLIRALASGLFLALSAAGAATAQQAAVSGRVMDVSSGQAVVGAQVMIAGTTLGTLSNSEGVYTIRGVTAGNVTVRALSVGYAEQSKQATVAAGQTASVDFELRPVAIEISPVIATVTGDQRRREVGNAIAALNAASIVERRSVSNMADLLVSKAAGVTV